MPEGGIALLCAQQTTAKVHVLKEESSIGHREGGFHFSTFCEINLFYKNYFLFRGGGIVGRDSLSYLTLSPAKEQGSRQINLLNHHHLLIMLCKDECT
mmetsp:Transcript_50497/g.93340  ORF Transcript_50497/g.93340 Transcript_50497/m.93340 type:complete len:98 (+) Transcript_50497:1675-1968(+)